MVLNLLLVGARLWTQWFQSGILVYGKVERIRNALQAPMATQIPPSVATSNSPTLATVR